MATALNATVDDFVFSAQASGTAGVCNRPIGDYQRSCSPSGLPAPVEARLVSYQDDVNDVPFASSPDPCDPAKRGHTDRVKMLLSMVHFIRCSSPVMLSPGRAGRRAATSLRCPSSEAIFGTFDNPHRRNSNSARTDPCGGPPVRAVPTAIPFCEFRASEMSELRKYGPVPFEFPTFLVGGGICVNRVLNKLLFDTIDYEVVRCRRSKV